MSGLMPRVAHIELFAASSGSSILRVLGTHKDFSIFSSLCKLASLECLPKVGEPFPEQLLLLVEDDGDMQPLDPTHGKFHAPLGQVVKPQNGAGMKGKGCVAAQTGGAAIIALGLHGTGLEFAFPGLHIYSDEHLPASITATLFQAGLHG